MAGYIDDWERGTLRIFNACKETSLPDPDIVEKDGGFMVALPKANVEVSVTAGEEGDTTGDQIENLTDRQKEVFELIKEDHTITRKIIADKPGITESAVQK